MSETRCGKEGEPCRTYERGLLTTASKSCRRPACNSNDRHRPCTICSICRSGPSRRRRRSGTSSPTWRSSPPRSPTKAPTQAPSGPKRRSPSAPSLHRTSRAPSPVGCARATMCPAVLVLTTAERWAGVLLDEAWKIKWWNRGGRYLGRCSLTTHESGP